MRDINPLLYEYVYQNIIPQYKEFDKGHSTDHVSAVIENSIEISESYDVDIDMIFVIAAYHDVGIKFGRKDHNITSAKIMREDSALNKWFSAEQKNIMSEAIEDHRASNNYEPRTIYGKIISEADRIIDVETILYRTHEFGKAKFPELSPTEQFERSYGHISEKYGDGGYLKLWLNTTKNEQGLSRLRALIKDKPAMKELYFSIAKNQQ